MKYSTVTSFFIGVASAQSISSVLSSAKDIGDIKDILSRYPAITSTLSAAKGVTVFLPRDGARGLDLLNFQADSPLRSNPGLIEATLTYHVVKGVLPAASVPAKAFVDTLLTSANYSSVSGGQKLEAVNRNGRVSLIGGGPPVNVVTADIKFDGGLIHLIDGVLQAPKSAVTVARLSGLSSLTRALTSAKLVSAIESAKDVTIFAPTNEAFETAEATLEKLNSSQVSSALQYHVVKGVGYSTQLQDGQLLPTLQGDSLKVGVKNGVVTINGARVAKADVLVKQGVVHVIDSVLVPK